MGAATSGPNITQPMQSRPSKVKVAVSSIDIPGAYHSSILIDKVEFSFSGRGIDRLTGFQSHKHYSPEVQDFGVTQLSSTQLLKALQSSFQAGTYDLLRKNCNSFTDCALFLLFGTRLDPRYRQMEVLGAATDQYSGGILRLGGYRPNPCADDFDLEAVIAHIGKTYRFNFGLDGMTPRAHTWFAGMEGDYWSAQSNMWIPCRISEVLTSGLLKLEHVDGSLLHPNADPQKIRRRQGFDDKENVCGKGSISVGEQVEVWSNTNQSWVKASVKAIHSTGNVVVKYADQDLQKDISPEDLRENVRVRAR